MILLTIVYLAIGLLISLFIKSYATEAYGSITKNFIFLWAALLSPFAWPFLPIIFGLLFIIKFLVSKVEEFGKYTAREVTNPRENT